MATQQKKGETKNQHYVPQFYQRNFSNDDKNIGAYVLEKSKYIPTAPIKTQSSGDYFYSDNMKIEKTLGSIEGMANVVIKKILEAPLEKLSKEDEYTLYVFTMLQAGRTNFQVGLIKESANLFVRNTLKKIIELKRKFGDADEVADITDDIIDRVELKFDSIGMMALGTQAQLVNTCIDLKYKIIINNTDKTFITSDNPAVIYDLFMQRMKQIYALGSRGLMIYLPLSPNIAVLYYDSQCYKVGDRKKTYVVLNSVKDVDELNKLIVVKASNVVYCRPDDYSAYQIGKFCDSAMKYRLPDKVAGYPEMVSKDGNPIIGSYHIPLFCNLSLSFMKELPKYSIVKPNQYNPAIHRLREIAYHRDDFILKGNKV